MRQGKHGKRGSARRIRKRLKYKNEEQQVVAIVQEYVTCTSAKEQEGMLASQLCRMSDCSCFASALSQKLFILYSEYIYESFWSLF